MSGTGVCVVLWLDFVSVFLHSKRNVMETVRVSELV